MSALGVLALLAAAPHAQAQAVGRYLRPGTAPPPPAQSNTRSNAPSNFSAMNPMRSAPVQRMPGPVWNQPRSAPPTPSAPSYSGPPPVQIYSREYRTGPTVTVPDSGDRGRRRDYPQNYGNGYGNGYGFGDGTNGGRVWTNGAAPPVGPGNGFFNPLTPPVGPANGFGENPGRRRDYPNHDYPNHDYPNHPNYWRGHPSRDHGSTYIYNNYPGGYANYGPPLLGGYYYGGYSNVFGSAYTYPSVYSVYSGFPRFIYGGGANVIVIGQPYQTDYDTSYLPFAAPSYSATYNQNNYYVANESRVQDLEAGGDRAREAVRNAWPDGSYQAAFGDIARAWTDGDVKFLEKHLRDDDTRVSVSLNKKYAYSLKSGDYAQITRDALDRLGTVSFEFTRLRKAKNGDVTAYGTHVYRSAQAASEGGQDGATVPFDQNGPSDGQADGGADGPAKTVYVSYTLHHQGSQWYIVSLDSSDQSLVPNR